MQSYIVDVQWDRQLCLVTKFTSYQIAACTTTVLTMRNVGCVRMLWCVTDIHGIFMAGVVCGNLDRPRFGRVVMTGITFGSIATYSCQIGYRLVGESTRTCQANRQWSGVAPVCKSERAKKDS